MYGMNRGGRRGFGGPGMGHGMHHGPGMGHGRGSFLGGIIPGLIIGLIAFFFFSDAVNCCMLQVD